MAILTLIMPVLLVQLVQLVPLIMLILESIPLPRTLWMPQILIQLIQSLMLILWRLYRIWRNTSCSLMIIFLLLCRRGEIGRMHRISDCICNGMEDG
ncbi:hypothetical protein BZA77DRAFT_307235 [Pyronema omphalodes]|nr:hypothetical protein BZA77DRAFT_307235 [Pyronema omphalodes]